MRTKGDDAIVKTALQILRRDCAAGAKCWPREEPGLVPLLDMLRLEYGGKPREHSGAIFLDGNGRLLGVECISVGESTSVSMCPRELVRAALHVNANALILWHTHPGGDHRPSQADIQATHGIAKLLQAIEILMYDHFVFSSEGFTSIRQHVEKENKS